jgi:prepilin-type processing-associated H-X9-DG protein/prepilin-type N-terminal cleavage/methylation domain-containing protein
MPHPPRQRPGFTLVELLVVVGIIALLIGILMPVLSAARAHGRRTKCLATLRQYAQANVMYANDHRNWYVPLKWGYANPGAGWPPLPAGLAPPEIPFQSWISNAGFFRALGLKAWTSDRVPNGLVCPDAVLSQETGNAKAGYLISRSYGYNLTGFNWYADPPRYYTGLHQGDLKRPSEKLMFIDATDWVVTMSQSKGYLAHGEVYGPPPYTNLSAYRHSRGANIAFFDGHAAWLPSKHVIDNATLWRLKE